MSEFLDWIQSHHKKLGLEFNQYDWTNESGTTHLFDSRVMQLDTLEFEPQSPRQQRLVLFP